MQYIKINDTKWVEVDEALGKSTIIDKPELEDQIEKWNAEIESLPELTDEFLLEWAKNNYPQGKQKTLLENLISTAEAKLANLV